MHMKKKLLAFGMAVLMLTGCGSSSGTIRFGAAGLGGTYHMFSDAFAEIIESESADCSIEVKTTAGSAANVRLLSDGYVQMAIAQADIINDAYYGVGMFENDKKYQGYSAVGGLYTEACQIVVRADSDIRSVEDLQGKTVSVGEEESGTEKNAEQILAAYGLSERLVTEVNLDYTDAVEQLKKKEIDAMFCTAGAYTTVIGELAKQCEIRFIDLDEKGIDKLMKSYDFYTECEIPENTYVGQTEAVRTVGVKAVLYDGSYHPVDSSEMAFKTATIQAFKKGFMEASPVLLEPIASLKVTVPDDYTGDIMGDLNKRRGRVLGMTPAAGGKQVIEADIPMTGLFGYCTTLRSMTGGRGSYEYTFARYEQAPSDVQEKEIAARAEEA